MLHVWRSGAGLLSLTLAATRKRKNQLRHRVGRVLSFSPVVGIGTPPPPRVRPPPFFGWVRGEGNTCWRERGWESPNFDEWTYTFGIYEFRLQIWFQKKTTFGIIFCSWFFFLLHTVFWKCFTGEQTSFHQEVRIIISKLFAQWLQTNQEDLLPTLLLKNHCNGIVLLYIPKKNIVSFQAQIAHE